MPPPPTRCCHRTVFEFPVAPNPSRSVHTWPLPSNIPYWLRRLHLNLKLKAVSKCNMVRIHARFAATQPELGAIVSRAR